MSMKKASGQRRQQILQEIAQMLESPVHEKVTTAILAKRLDISEATLYRHFASKAQMFDELIVFIESSIFTLFNQIDQQEEKAINRLELKLKILLQFSQKNRGLTRVLVGDALVNENDRLRESVNQLLVKIEGSIKQTLRVGMAQSEIKQIVNSSLTAAFFVTYIEGQWQRFVRSQFEFKPLDNWSQHGQWLLASIC